MLQREVNN